MGNVFFSELLMSVELMAECFYVFPPSAGLVNYFQHKTNFS